MKTRGRQPFENAAILGSAALVAVVLGQIALLFSRSLAHPQQVFVEFLWAMAIVLPAIAVGLVWHRVVTEKVRRRLAEFESRFPTRTVVGVMDQAGFAAALASLGVRSRRRLIVGVLVIDREVSRSGGSFASRGKCFVSLESR